MALQQQTDHQLSQRRKLCWVRYVLDQICDMCSCNSNIFALI